MATPALQLELAQLGETHRHAIRRVLTEFRLRGWRDVDGAAVSIVDRLTKGGGRASPKSAARAVPATFLAINGLSRAELSRVLERLAGTPR